MQMKKNFLSLTILLSLKLAPEFDHTALSKASASGDGQTKKPTTSDFTESLTMSDLLLPTKRLIIGNRYVFSLGFDQMVDFMGPDSGEKDILDLIDKYTKDAEGVVSQLCEVYKVLDHKSIKHKCKKTQRRIKKAIHVYGALDLG